jgi:hypothetical protein
MNTGGGKQSVGIPGGRRHLRSDRSGVAFVQPIHVEQGCLNLTRLDIIGCERGEPGAASRFNAVDRPASELALGVAFARTVLSGTRQVARFVRAQALVSGGSQTEVINMLAGRPSISICQTSPALY